MPRQSIVRFSSCQLKELRADSSSSFSAAAAGLRADKKGRMDRRKAYSAEPVSAGSLREYSKQ